MKCPLLFAFLSLFGPLVAQNSDAWKVAADSLYDRHEFENAINACKKHLAVFEKSADWPNWTAAQIAIADNLDELERISEAIEILQNAAKKAEKITRFPLGQQALQYSWLGLYQYKCNDFGPALKNLQRAARLFEQQNELGKEPARALLMAGQIFVRQLDYPNALRFFEAAIRVDTGKTRLESAYLNLSIAQFFMGKYPENIQTAEKGLALKNLKPNYQAMLQSILADGLAAIGQLDRAEKLQLSALQFYQKDENHEACKDVFQSLASIVDKKNHPARATQFFKKALAECRAAFPEKNRETAKTHVHYGEFLEKRGRFSEALAQYQQAIIQVFHPFNDTDPLKNPPVSMAWVESFGMTAPAKKAALLLRIADYGLRIQTGKSAPEKSAIRNPQSAILQSAAESFDLAFACIRQLRDGYGDEAAKLYLGEHVHNYLENALETRRQLFEMTGDEQHLARFFELMEENKAAVLAEALRKNRAFEAAGIPDSLLEREIGLRRDLADLRADLQTTVSADQKSIDEIKLKIAALERQQTALLARMTTQFPDFHRLATRRQPPALADVFQKLMPGEALLEFFEGEKAIFILLFFDGKISLRRLEKADGLNADLAAFRRFFLNKSLIEANPAHYFELANRLFQKICPLPEGVSRLLIVPDGQLGFLPFEALLTEKGWSGNFAAAPFLLKKTTVWQSWSAELWLHPLGWSGKTGGVKIQFAPIFANSERGLSPLLHSPDEAQHAGFQRFASEKATADQFLSLAREPLAVLHLSTHATADPDHSGPRIEFFDRAVPLHEIFASRLRAELVVLSACETGIGQIERGEGLMSLARAFSYAGARSLVASLWKVNEQSTARLFSDFYEKLAAGLSRSEALREAKIGFLQSSELDARKSPFYWAGFILIGEDGSLKSGGGGLPWPILSLLFAAVFGLFWMAYKLKMRTRI